MSNEPMWVQHLQSLLESADCPPLPWRSHNQPWPDQASQPEHVLDAKGGHPFSGNWREVCVAIELSRRAVNALPALLADHAAASRLAEIQEEIGQLRQESAERYGRIQELNALLEVYNYSKYKALLEELDAARAIAPECQHEVTSRLTDRGEYYGSGTLTDWLWCATCGAIKVHDSNQDWSRPANGTRSLPKRLNFLEAENATLTGRAALADEIAPRLRGVHYNPRTHINEADWLARYDALAATSPAVEPEGNRPMGAHE